MLVIFYLFVQHFTQRTTVLSVVTHICHNGLGYINLLQSAMKKSMILLLNLFVLLSLFHSICLVLVSPLFSLVWFGFCLPPMKVVLEVSIS